MRCRNDMVLRRTFLLTSFSLRIDPLTERSASTGQSLPLPHFVSCLLALVVAHFVLIIDLPKNDVE